MKRVFENIRTGEILYIEDTSEEFKKFKKENLKAGEEKYSEWFLFQDK